jgi:GNAT superfamily N-acetyltransferase
MTDRLEEAMKDVWAWKRQAEDAQWFTASLEGDDAGVAVAVLGWHSPPGVARLELAVMPSRRGRGVGSAAHCRRRVVAPGRCSELLGAVREDDPSSLRRAERRGFREVGRNSCLRSTWTGRCPRWLLRKVEITTWAERSDLAQHLLRRARGVSRRPRRRRGRAGLIRGLAVRRHAGRSDRPEATFVALPTARSSVRSSRSSARPTVVMLVTGVKRAWRGRGIAGALKRAEIAWAKRAGSRGWRRSTRSATSRFAVQRTARLSVRAGPIIVRGPIA